MSIMNTGTRIILRSKNDGTPVEIEVLEEGDRFRPPSIQIPIAARVEQLDAVERAARVGPVEGRDQPLGTLE